MLEAIQEKFGGGHVGAADDGVSERNNEHAGLGPVGSALTLGAAIGAALLTRKLLEAGWQATTHREPPKNPASSEVAWKDAIVWGGTSGACVGIARIVSRRLSTSAYHNLRS